MWLVQTQKMVRRRKYFGVDAKNEQADANMLVQTQKMVRRRKNVSADA
ncbi:hypothetical protein [Bacillus timonensis]|nr:hypothetical protein [Bacillus timonensis]